MHTTCALLDAFKAKRHIPSDYALAAALGVSKQKISQYRRGDYCLGDDRAREIADALGLDRGEVLLSIHAERARKQHDEATFNDLSALLRRLGGLAASFFVVFLFSAAPDASAAMRPSFNDNTHYATRPARAACIGATLCRIWRAVITLLASLQCAPPMTKA